MAIDDTTPRPRAPRAASEVHDFKTAQAAFKVDRWEEQGNDRVGLAVPDDVARRVGLQAGAKVKATVWGSRGHTVTGYFEDILVAAEGRLLLLTTDHLRRLNYPSSLEVRIVEVYSGLSAEETARLEGAMASFDSRFDAEAHEKKLECYDEYVQWFKEDFLQRRVLDPRRELGARDMDELLSWLDYTAESRKEGAGFFRTGLSAQLWQQMVENPGPFREAVRHLLTGEGPLERRINDVMKDERFEVRNFRGQNLIPVTALLLSTNREAYVHVLSMSHKERKLRALGLMPTLPAEAGPGERFVAFDRAILGLRDRFKLSWDTRKLSLFLYSEAFLDAFERGRGKFETAAAPSTGLARALVWSVPGLSTRYRGACRDAEQNRRCGAPAAEKKRCVAGFGCDAAYALRDRILPLPEEGTLTPAVGEAVFVVAPGEGGRPELQALMVAREGGRRYPLKLDNGDVRYLERYVRASPDYLFDLTDRPLPWPLARPEPGLASLSSTDAIAVLRAVQAAAPDERLAVLVRCYQGLEDPSVTTERLFKLEDFLAYLHGDGACRFHFPDKLILNYHAALRTKPFVLLTGLSGTGKTKLAQLYAQYMTGQPHAGDRYEMIAVRPDWTDGKGLLGFYNILTERYQSTPFLDLLLRAARAPARRHYVVLDEMNLAKVEYYFSDFLSAMESGEEIELHDLPGDAVKAGGETDVGYEGIPPRVRVPRNLAFTGTVNIDETTYMFSPKVLDRANTIEFNEVDLDRYFELNATPGLEKQAQAVVNLNKLLTRHQMQFGYRVAGEILGYLRGAARLGLKPQEALDLQIRQKVLPKFHGSRSKLEDALVSLLGVTAAVRTDDDPEEQERLLERLAGGDATGAPFPESARKVARMLRDLRRDGFVSFA